LLKCFVRKIINEEDYNYIMEELNKLPKEINSPIYYTNTKLKF